MHLTKSTFLQYLQCPKNFWLYHYKPELFADIKESDFEKQLSEQGQEVERWARKLFSQGVLAGNNSQEALKTTPQLMADGKDAIFQATVEADSCLVMVDVLEYDTKNKHWIINEVKGSTSKQEPKSKYLYDAGFQKIVLERSGIKVGKVNLIELNKEFQKDGDILPKLLLKITDISTEIKDLESELLIQVDDALRTLKKMEEPRVCNCIYKSRANQCPTFSYSHPEVPDYSVHDITRIGSSLKNLEKLVDADILEITDVPDDFGLSKNQMNQVIVTKRQVPIIRTSKIQAKLEKLVFPLYFFDYETFPTAVPIFDGCRPYQQVPFQFSLHAVYEDEKITHNEYVHHTDGNPMPIIAEELAKHIGEIGSVVVWNKKFEMKCNEDLAQQVPEYADFFHDLNQRKFDLMEIFSKQLCVHPDFRGSASIKKVLPVIVPGLSYKDLAIQDGGMACNSWKQMMFGSVSQAEKDQIYADLLKYCELDTEAMVKIWEVLLKI